MKNDLRPLDAQGNRLPTASLKPWISVHVYVDGVLVPRFVTSTNPWTLIDADPTPRSAGGAVLTPSELAALQPGGLVYVVKNGALVQGP